MNLKKLLVIILSVIMLISVLPAKVFAQDKKSEPLAQNVVLSSDDVSLTATNSFGAMLADELEEAKLQNENSGNVIYSVEVELNSAYVELSTAVEATLLVGIYSEDCSSLLTSGYTKVSPEDEYAFVTLENTPPEYFYIKAYLVDSEDYSPISAVHNNALYTQEMQEFLSKTTDDFEQDKVINLDDNKANNFAVLSDDVINIGETASTNKVTFADVNSKIYILENIDESVSNLKVGDTFTADFGGELYIITIGEIEIDGTTATILGADAELEDVFDFVKIDNEIGITEGSVDESSCGEGITFDGYEYPTTYGLRGFDFEGDIGADAKFKIELLKKGSDGANVSINGNFNLKFVFSPKIYISTNYKYVELKFDYKLSGGISITGKLELEVPIAPLTFGVPGISADITPKFVVSASGSVSVTGTFLEGTLGYGWYSNVGGINLCSTPKMDIEVKAEITVFIGLRVGPEITVLEGYIAEAELEANLGAEAKATLSGSVSDLFNTSEKHDCTFCVEGEIYGKFDLSVNGKLLKNNKWKLELQLAELKIKITDFYWSMTYGEFRFTTCPHMSYKLEVIVADTSGKAIYGADVTINNETFSTFENGTISTYLPDGEYKVSATKEEYNPQEKTVTINGDSKSLKLTLEANSGTDDEIGGEIGGEIKPQINSQILSLGNEHSAIIDANGDLYTWGLNYFGKLGDGTTNSSHTPKKIMSNAVAVSLGGDYSAAIDTNGDLYTWGGNYNGQLGDGNTYSNYIPKRIMNNVVSISLGYWHCAAIDANGDLYMWGHNGYGQLGDGTTTDRYTPTKIMSNVTFVSLGTWHSAAITANGELYTWGYNCNGQLGDGSTTDSYIPTKIMSNVASVSLGGEHSAAITADGNLYTWGWNRYGQLGDGNTTIRKIPTKILNKVASVSLGRHQSAAITANGELYTWGYNCYGQLGDGTTHSSHTPIKIMSNVASVSLGGDHSAAITKDGELYTWGWNWYGQLGDGTTANKHTPTKIEIPSAETQEVMLFSSLKRSSLEQSSFYNLEPNSIYNFYIMKSREAENAFDSENLLYINQGITNQNGYIAFEYLNGGEDFNEAEKFVVTFKNALPDSTIPNKVITANKDKIFLNLKGTSLENSGYQNITAKFTLNGESYNVSNFVKMDDNLLFTYTSPEKLTGETVATVQIFADLNGTTYESQETHITLMTARNDINADGIINASDLATLRRAIISDYQNNAQFDPSGDGNITVIDLVRLKKYLAKIGG